MCVYSGKDSRSTCSASTLFFSLSLSCSAVSMVSTVTLATAEVCRPQKKIDVCYRVGVRVEHRLRHSLLSAGNGRGA